MKGIQNTFSIKDLETLSGIKAHTIRIWEKRYDLLNPSRLNRNIRIYSLLDLQKLLNISLLYKHGYKISKLAAFTYSQLEREIKTISIDKASSDYYINSIIKSMYALDDQLFEDTYLLQIEKKICFEEIFVHTYAPILHHIGLLWQTDAIKPIHEHFLSNLIYQKIVLNTASLPGCSAQDKPVFVLFLPDGEIHEIGLLFLNYYLKSKGKKTIYLGRSIPFNNLTYINSQFKDITWVTSFIIDKTEEEKKNFIIQMKELLDSSKNNCWIFGNMWEAFSNSSTNNSITFHKGFKDILA